MYLKNNLYISKSSNEPKQKNISIIKINKGQAYIKMVLW